MTFPLPDLIAAALAASAVVDVWRRGSIFAGARARSEDRGGRLDELLGCRYCLSPWAVAAVLGFSIVPALYLDAAGSDWSLLFRAPAYLLAIDRLLILELDLRGLGP